MILWSCISSLIFLDEETVLATDKNYLPQECYSRLQSLGLSPVNLHHIARNYRYALVSPFDLYNCIHLCMRVTGVPVVVF